MTGNESRYTSPFETRPGYFNSTSSVLAEQENTSATAKYLKPVPVYFANVLLANQRQAANRGKFEYVSKLKNGHN